jgi:hypothetical protein
LETDGLAVGPEDGHRDGVADGRKDGSTEVLGMSEEDGDNVVNAAEGIDEGRELVDGSAEGL